MHARKIAALVSICFFAAQAFAGPPFLTDDPEPVELHHYEAYLFSTTDHASDSTTGIGPGVEMNWGAVPNLQLHIVLPLAYNFATDGPITYGPGDVELGAKYRFVDEKGKRPMIGIFPMLELATGSPRRGLGNGQTWARLPLWIQKSSGPWTTYGGVGYVVNNAPGMRSYPFAGWLAQRDLSKKLTLGAEVFGQGPTTGAGRETTIFNAGGFYNFSENFSLLFSAGHSVRGESHAVAYLGLYWTWGRKENKGGGGKESLLERIASPT
jgi:hypothetical protein